MKHAGPAAVMALAVALSGALSLAEEPGAADTVQDSPEATQPQQTTMTRGEIQRRLDEARARLEDILVTLEGVDQPTREQLERFREARREVAALERQLEDTAPPTPSPEDDSWKARWARFRKGTEDLTRYDLKDGMLRFRLGLRLQLDATGVYEDEALEDVFGNLPNDTSVRRARLFAEGRFLRRFDFNFTYDFGADPGIKSAYLEGVKFAKLVRWRVGIFQEPFSLEKKTNYAYNAFLEGSLPVETLAPGSNAGAMLRGSEVGQRLTWAVSATTNTTSGADNAGSANYTLTTRVTGTPLYRRDGSLLVHLGLGLGYRNPEGGDIRYKARPEARFVTPLLDTGGMSANSNSLRGFEFATVQGPWWAQYEWIFSRLDADSLGDPSFSGSYIEVGRFLTGESRRYDRREGVFDRVLPFRPYEKKGNPFKKESAGGALEVTGRLSTVDLSDEQVQAGELSDLTLGMNWYLTPTTAFLLNYVHSDVDPGGEAHILLIRYQFAP